MCMNKYQVVLNWFVDLLRRDVVAKQNAKILQELVDKETPLKPTNQVVIDFGLGNAGNCKACNREVNYQNKYCDNCGWKIDWGYDDDE